jgi:hypothetical protein
MVVRVAKCSGMACSAARACAAGQVSGVRGCGREVQGEEGDAERETQVQWMSARDGGMCMVVMGVCNA